MIAAQRYPARFSTLSRRRRRPLIRRGSGRPLGSRDRRGKARRTHRTVVEAVTKAFAAQIRHVRESANISASELAAAIGLHPRTLFGYESGRAKLPLYRLVAIALALGVPFEHLVPEV